MTPNQLDRMLDQAMQEKAPKVRQRLQSRKQLTPYIRQLTGRTLDEIGEAKMQAGGATATQGNSNFIADAMERIQAINSKFQQIEAEAIRQAIEEIEALETTEWRQC